jgi:hypothetical protein
LWIRDDARFDDDVNHDDNLFANDVIPDADDRVARDVNDFVADERRTRQSDRPLQGPRDR